MRIPRLEDDLVVVRDLELSDLAACNELYSDIGWSDPNLSWADNLARRRDWLDWVTRGYSQLAALHQPPYGERAITDRQHEFVGLVGVVPRLDWLFDVLGLERVLAGTEADNVASVAVMRRLGMRIVPNPGPPEPGMEVTGILKASSRREVL